jgi:hypothetical protein
VKELRRQRFTQEQIAERMGMDAETVASWLHAPEFPERQIRSDRRRIRPCFCRSRPEERIQLESALTVLRRGWQRC